MKYPIQFFLIIILAFCSCNQSGTAGSQTTITKTETAQHKTTAETVADLREAAVAYQTNSNRESSIAFMKSFPNSFEKFTAVFGYDDAKRTEMPLYKEAMDYLNILFAGKDIEPKQFYDLIIGISQEGRWEADAVNYLKMKTDKLVQTDPKFLTYLGEQSEEKQYNFWYFLFDGPHPPKDYPNQTVEALSKHQNMLETSKKAFLEVQKDNRHH